MAAFPDSFRIGPEWNNYIYEPATQDHSSNHVWFLSGLKNSNIVVGMWAVCPRLRHDVDAPDKVYNECCQAAQAWDVQDGHALYIIKGAGVGRKWVATHAPKGSS